MEIGLSFGSNQGDRLQNLRKARALVAGLPSVSIMAASPVYDTEPVDVAEELRAQSFLNAVLIVESEGGIHSFSRAIHAIEDDMGRVRGPDRNAPRVIDIDIIYAGAEHRSETALSVPHPRWKERRFVVQPLADVRPDLVIPGEQRSVGDILAGMPQAPTARFFCRDWEMH